MANPEHVKKLKEGLIAWNSWRSRTDETPDLSGVWLDGDSLDHYHLESADFSDAALNRVSFRFSRCDRCSFVGARLKEVTFYGASISGCNFTNAEVWFSVFRS